MKKPATKSSGKPSIRRQQIIVLVDGAGDYYELPRATLERRKVSESRKKEVASALKNVEAKYTYINRSAIPGSTAAPKFVGGSELAYAGFYISSPKSKR
jgi:hypothetical protein